MQSRLCFPGKLRIFFLGFDNSKYMDTYETSHKAFYSNWKKAESFFFSLFHSDSIKNTRWKRTVISLNKSLPTFNSINCFSSTFTVFPPQYLLTIKCILICCHIDFHELFRQFLPEQGEQAFPLWHVGFKLCY